MMLDREHVVGVARERHEEADLSAGVEGPLLAGTLGVAGAEDGLSAAASKVGRLATLLSKVGFDAGVGDGIDTRAVENHGGGLGVAARAAVEARLEGRGAGSAEHRRVVVAVRIHRRRWRRYGGGHAGGIGGDCGL